MPSLGGSTSISRTQLNLGRSFYEYSGNTIPSSDAVAIPAGAGKNKPFYLPSKSSNLDNSEALDLASADRPWLVQLTYFTPTGIDYSSASGTSAATYPLAFNFLDINTYRPTKNNPNGLLGFTSPKTLDGANLLAGIVAPEDGVYFISWNVWVDMQPTTNYAVGEAILSDTCVLEFPDPNVAGGVASTNGSISLTAGGTTTVYEINSLALNYTTTGGVANGTTGPLASGGCKVGFVVENPLSLVNTITVLADSYIVKNYITNPTSPLTSPFLPLMMFYMDGYAPPYTTVEFASGINVGGSGYVYLKAGESISVAFNCPVEYLPIPSAANLMITGATLQVRYEGKS